VSERNTAGRRRSAATLPGRRNKTSVSTSRIPRCQEKQAEIRSDGFPKARAPGQFGGLALIPKSLAFIPQIWDTPGRLGLSRRPLDHSLHGTHGGQRTVFLRSVSLSFATLLQGLGVNLPDLPPLFVYGFVLVGFVVTNLMLAHLLGPKKKTPVKDMPYESGMDPVGDARQPFDVRFYLVAILFLVFDVELLFLYPWAVSAYSDGGVPPQLRDTVFAIMLIFMFTLALAWVYAWRKGVFRWR
jgi:NADH-quinone oxidoreductase subunit A